MNVSSINEASGLLYDAILRHLMDSGGRVHVETAISAAGGLCGTAMLNLSGKDLSQFQPGTVIITDEVNELGPVVVSFMQSACQKAGIEAESGWENEVPGDNQPHKNSVELAKELAAKSNEIYTRCAVPDNDKPLVCALTAVRFIGTAREILDPNVGKSLALWAIVQASKTVPLADKQKKQGVLGRLFAHSLS